MKRLKKIFIILLIICVIAILIKSQIRLVKLSDRAVSPCAVEINDVGGLTSVKDIAEYAKRKAADDLEFSRHNDIANRKANYACMLLIEFCLLKFPTKSLNTQKIFRQKIILLIVTESLRGQCRQMSLD